MIGLPRRWPRESRGFGDFLRAVRAVPGFGWRTGSLAAFTLSLWVTKGYRSALVALAIGLALAILIGYPRFRRRGRIL